MRGFAVPHFVIFFLFCPLRNRNTQTTSQWRKLFLDRSALVPARQWNNPRENDETKLQGGKRGDCTKGRGLWGTACWEVAAWDGVGWGGEQNSTVQLHDRSTTPRTLTQHVDHPPTPRHHPAKDFMFFKPLSPPLSPHTQLTNEAQRMRLTSR